MVVMNFLKLFITVFILRYRVGFSPWAPALRHAVKLFGYFIFLKNAIFPKFLQWNLYKTDTFFCTNGVRFIEIPL